MSASTTSNMRKSASKGSKGKSDFPAPRPSRATQPVPRWDLLLQDKLLATDFEFQSYRVPNQVPGQEKNSHRIAWVAVTNSKGEIVFEVFVDYWSADRINERVRSSWNWKFGVEPEDLLRQNGAMSGRKCERILRRLFKGRTVIVHDQRGERKAFFYEKDVFCPEKNGVNLQDTQKLYNGLDGIATPGLDRCVAKVLGKSMRLSGVHSPIEDARMTMELFLAAPAYKQAQLSVPLYADSPAHTKCHEANEEDEPENDVWVELGVELPDRPNYFSDGTLQGLSSPSNVAPHLQAEIRAHMHSGSKKAGKRHRKHRY